MFGDWVILNCVLRNHNFVTIGPCIACSIDSKDTEILDQTKQHLRSGSLLDRVLSESTREQKLREYEEERTRYVMMREEKTMRGS